jgi:DNA-directed RNA polymerase specialized sigma24 family protein
MDDRLLVEALQSRDPGALGEVYESYAEQIYGYCWFQLRSRDGAQVALRDTFIVAEAHIDKLHDPDRFGPWLYAIARIECGRRLPIHGQKPDIPIANHDQVDVDQRIMAWRAVMGLVPLSRELLELRERHGLAGPDLAAVVGLSARDLEEALDQAHAELETALTAELLAHEGPYDCDGRAAILSGRNGELPADVRGQLLLHARGCEVCGAYQARAVSPSKVYGMLPTALPPEALRLRVMSCFTDPELVGYRLFVATRLSDFAPNGFPRQPSGLLPVWRDPGAGAEEATLSTSMMVMVVALVVGVVIIASALSRLLSGHLRDARTVASQSRPSSPTQPRIVTPPPVPRSIGKRGGDVAGSPVSATFPLGVRQSSAPATASPAPPTHLHESGPGSPEQPAPHPEPSCSSPSTSPTPHSDPPTEPAPDPTPTPVSHPTPDPTTPASSGG